MGNKGKYRRRRRAQEASNSGAPSPPGSTSGISSAEASSSGAATPNTETCHQMITENLADSMSKLTLSAKMVNRDENRASLQASSLHSTSTAGPSSSAVGATRNSLDTIRKNPKSDLKDSKTIRVISNSFKLTSRNEKAVTIFQYDMSIRDRTNNTDIESPSKSACISAFEAFRFAEYVAFDGKKNVYSPRLLETGIVEFPFERKPFEAQLQGPTTECSINDILDKIHTPNGIIRAEVISTLTILFNHSITRGGVYHRHRRGFLSWNEQGYALSEGLDVWPGFKFSIIATEGSDVVVRINKTFVPMVKKSSLLKFIFEGGNIRRQMATDEINKKSALLKRLKVVTVHNNRKYTLRGLSHETPASYVFPDSGITIEAYFRTTYNRVLEYPNLPCAKVDNRTLLPIELCNITEVQPLEANLPREAQKNFIKKSREDPDDKLESVKKCRDILVDAVNPWLKDNYGLVLSKSLPIVVNAKILSPPKLRNSSQNSANLKVTNGSWRNSSIFNPSAIPSPPSGSGIVQLQMISLDDDLTVDKLKLMDTHIRNKAKNMGIKYPDRNVEYTCITKLNLDSQIRKARYSFVIMNNNEEYGEIKNAETASSRIQCITAQVAEKISGDTPNQRIIENILYKYNMKISGYNWTVDLDTCQEILSLFIKFTMIIGADVTHLTEREDMPSLASVVGSYNKSATRFYSAVSPLFPESGKQSVEYISSIDSILRKFVSKKSGIPSNIIYLRDGVSRAQFENTAMKELALMKSVCPETKFAVIICTKLHDQRFVKQRGNGYDNLDSGTVVDENVVDANYFNFYLCSHASTQGTSVPCHYYVLYDDFNISATAWQTYCFYLCHSYGIVSKSVSYPAPVYYAHNACSSARERFLAGYKDTVWDEIDEAELPSAEEIAAKIHPYENCYH